MIEFKKRLNYGTEREKLFRDYIDKRLDWQCKEAGKGLLSPEQRDQLNTEFLAFDSNLSTHLLSKFPAKWRETYLESLRLKGTAGLPIKERFEADAKCFYQNKIAFDAEIKSDMTTWPNITFCLSGFMWALESQSQGETEKIYIWDVGDDVSQWRYLFLDQIIDYTLDVRTGIGLKGSQTPHGRVPKAKLEASTQYLCDLLSYFETVEF